VLAVAFAAMALTGVFRSDNSASDTPPRSVATAGPETSPDGPSDTNAAGGAEEDEALVDDPAVGEAPQVPDSQPSGPTDQPAPTRTDDAGSAGTAADPSGQGDATAGSEATAPPNQGESAPPAGAADDYCSWIKRSEDVLTNIQVNPNDLQAMAAAMESYLEAIKSARAVAPESVHGELDVVIAYWEPLVAAAHNPMSAQGGVGSQDMMDAYADAMTSLYEKHGTLCG
jgi:hypothetical protein